MQLSTATDFGLDLTESQVSAATQPGAQDSPRTLSLDLLAHVAGAGPNGGWNTDGPNGGWVADGPNGGW